MKKMLMIVTGVCAVSLSLLVSCSSAKAAEESADQYGTVVTPAQKQPADISGTEKTVPVQKDQISVPQQGNAFTRFFTGNMKDLELNTVKLFQLTVANKLQQEDATIIYNIKSEKTGFSAWYQTNWYHLLFTDSTRGSLASAEQLYLSDFEQKKLDRKNSKSYKIYGELPVTIRWGTIPGMESGYADTYVQFGYEFKKGSPYFSITVWQTKNQAYDDRSSEVQNSSTLHFYMNRAQVTQMSDLLSDAKITEALAPYMKNMQENANPAKDSY
jgi:hypothetical protein